MLPWDSNQAPEMGEALAAVGGKVAVLPPAPYLAQQMPDARPRRNAERGHVMSGEGEFWRGPAPRRIEHFGEARRCDPAVCGNQQSEVGVVPGAEPVERPPPPAWVGIGVARPRRSEA